jgi:hypothetical protein
VRGGGGGAPAGSGLARGCGPHAMQLSATAPRRLPLVIQRNVDGLARRWARPARTRCCAHRRRTRRSPAGGLRRERRARCRAGLHEMTIPARPAPASAAAVPRDRKAVAVAGRREGWRGMRSVRRVAGSLCRSRRAVPINALGWRVRRGWGVGGGQRGLTSGPVFAGRRGRSRSGRWRWHRRN